MHAQHMTSRDRALKTTARMPMLDHYRRGRPFDIMQSDVASWLWDQAAIWQFLFNHFKGAGAIIFVDGRWVGAQTYAESQSDELNE